MKMLLGPDLHCFYPNYGHMLGNGENSRFADWKTPLKHWLIWRLVSA